MPEVTSDSAVCLPRHPLPPCLAAIVPFGYAALPGTEASWTPALTVAALEGSPQ